MNEWDIIDKSVFEAYHNLPLSTGRGTATALEPAPITTITTTPSTSTFIDSDVWFPTGVQTQPATQQQTTPNRPPGWYDEPDRSTYELKAEVWNWINQGTIGWKYNPWTGARLPEMKSYEFWAEIYWTYVKTGTQKSYHPETGEPYEIWFRGFHEAAQTWTYNIYTGERMRHVDSLSYYRNIYDRYYDTPYSYDPDTGERLTRDHWACADDPSVCNLEDTDLQQFIEVARGWQYNIWTGAEMRHGNDVTYYKNIYDAFYGKPQAYDPHTGELLDSYENPCVTNPSTGEVICGGDKPASGSNNGMLMIIGVLSLFYIMQQS